MMDALILSLGAVLGALLRWGVARALPPAEGGFPRAVLAVNLAGAALIGAYFGLSQQRAGLHETARLFFVVGFLGSLTTFSSFSWEALQLWRNQGAGLALGYVLANNLGCLGLAFAGWRLMGGR